MVYIYSKVGDLTLLDTVATPGSFPDAVAMFNGDLIVADSVTGKIYIYSGTSTVAYKDSYAAAGGGIVTGFAILKNKLIHCEINDPEYPTGNIYVHQGMSDTIQTTYYSPSEMPHALTAALGDLFSADRWDQRIYRHSGQTNEIKSYYDAYKLTVSPYLSDVRGLAYDSCNDLLEYDGRERKLYVHDGVTSSIQATVNYAKEFTDISCPVGSSSSSSSSSSNSSSSSSSSSSETPLVFQQVGHIDDGGTALRVHGYGNYIYLANSGDGLRAYTFSDPTFTNVGHVDDGGWASGVFATANNIFLANGDDGLRAYDFDGANFSGDGHIDDGGYAQGLFVYGTEIFLANEVDGLRLYTKIGSNFSSDAHIDDGGNALDVWADGTYVFLANGGDGLRVYTRTGNSFNNVGHIDDGAGDALEVWSDGTYIYVAYGHAGIRAYTWDGVNLTNVGVYNPEGTYSPPTWVANGVGCDGTHIYAAASFDGIYAVTFDGSTFTKVANLDVASNPAYSCWCDGSHVCTTYMARHNAGLYAYTWK